MSILIRNCLIKSTYILFIFFIVAIFSCISASRVAFAKGLPELPEGIMLEESAVKQTKAENSSWWDDVLGFLGFGKKDEPKIVTQQEVLAPEEFPLAVRPTFEVEGESIPEVKDDGYLLDEFEKEKKVAKKHKTLIAEDNIVSKPPAEMSIPSDGMTISNEETPAMSLVQDKDIEFSEPEVFAEFADETTPAIEKTVIDAERKVEEVSAKEVLPVLETPTEEVVADSSAHTSDKFPDLEIPDLPDVPTLESIRAAKESESEKKQSTDGPDVFTEEQIAAEEVKVDELIAKSDEQKKEEKTQAKPKTVAELYGREEELAELDAVPGLGASDATSIKDENKQAIEQVDSRVSKFRKQLQQRLKNQNAIPQIDEKAIDVADSDDDSVLSQEIDNKQLKFVQNEAQVLVLPNDEVVLGEINEDAKLELIDFNEYVKLFWRNYARVKAEPKRQMIESFIEHYDDNFNTEQFLYNDDNEYDALEVAFKAIENEDIDELRIMLNNYAILQLTSKGDNNMLHKAALHGNYRATKLLLMRGIELRAYNQRGANAMTIAQRYGGEHVVYILNRAGL